MLYLLIKAALSGILIALQCSPVPRTGCALHGHRLGMIWLWHDKADAANMAAHAEATFWFVLPSLPLQCSLAPRASCALRSC